MVGWQLAALVLAVAVVALVLASVKVLREYERGVTFRLGRLRPVLAPGVRMVVPGVDKLVRVDLRVVTLTIPPQEVITKDNVPARVNAVVLFKVTDPVSSVMAVENHAVATSQIAQTTLRSVVGRADLDTLLAHRADLNEDLARTIADQTEGWGVQVSVVEIKDVEIPEAMQRAMAREAEAERERRQLRYLQTLLELGADQNSTVVFPLPIDIMGAFLDKLGAPGRQAPNATPSDASTAPSVNGRSAT
jgi:regulator of protease activity HflC (stomatin/prohibitin superfamily)